MKHLNKMQTTCCVFLVELSFIINEMNTHIYIYIYMVEQNNNLSNSSLIQYNKFVNEIKTIIVLLIEIYCFNFCY